ncbi:MAG: hypothetical protein WJ289_02675 [Ferrovum myxofaciens]|nr:hypothetical protein [Ferrovum myxofaciens]QWY74434.1 MAG: hypothetical protein JVY19_11610 [Ferrovum myxofaciens]
MMNFVYRSGNYPPEFVMVQAIFPDWECPVLLGVLCLTIPILPHRQ